MRDEQTAKRLRFSRRGLRQSAAASIDARREIPAVDALAIDSGARLVPP
jgi:hypothetical protein